MKYISILILSILGIVTNISAQEKTLYDFKVKDIDGNVFDMATLKGKKILIVNVASKCGFTPQYADLQKLYTEYKDKDFVIIGFPANNFKEQEPENNDSIKQFCTLNYGVTFPMMSKVSVKGKNMAPIYQWLTQKSQNGKLDAPVEWNFQKYMIDRDGKLVDVALSAVNPLSEEIITWIETE